MLEFGIWNFDIFEFEIEKQRLNRLLMEDLKWFWLRDFFDLWFLLSSFV